jgi:hypothetical protein
MGPMVHRPVRLSVDVTAVRDPATARPLVANEPPMIDAEPSQSLLDALPPCARRGKSTSLRSARAIEN